RKWSPCRRNARSNRPSWMPRSVPFRCYHVPMAPKILIVEDEGIIAKLLTYQLLELGYRVAGVARDHASAVRLADETKPDMVLMDIRLRGSVDGIETAKILRDRHRLALVYLTAQYDDATIRRALETEPAGYLSKPYS